MNNAEIRKLKYQEELKGERGLKVKKNKGATASFILQKHMKGTKNALRLKLGTWPDMSIDQALSKAMEYRSLIGEGIDPRDYEKDKKKREDLKKKEEYNKSVTLAQLHDMYMKEKYSEDRHALSTIRSYYNTMQSVWKPFWHNPIQEITKDRLWDHYQNWISQRPSKRTGKPAKQQILKALRYLKAELNYAIHIKDYITTNPCDIFRGRVSLQSGESTQHLTIRESQELWEYLGKLYGIEEADCNPLQLDEVKSWELGQKVLNGYAEVQLEVIALELLSGLRQVEVRELTWDKVYLDKPQYDDGYGEGPYFEITTSKQRKPFGIPITKQMENLFRRRLKKKKNNYVFPSPFRKNMPIAEDRYGFRVLQKLMPPSSLKNSNSLTSKVLRDTFATAGYALTRDASLIQRLTAHFSAQNRELNATAGYIHIQATDHRPYFEQINSFLTGEHELPDEIEDWDDMGNFPPLKR